MHAVSQPRRFPGRIARGLAVLALVFSLGLHWAFLQSVAWVGMAVDHAATLPLGEAVSAALDGQHPCRLCRFVQAGQAQENEEAKASPNPSSRLDLFLVTPPADFIAGPGVVQPRVPSDETASLRGEAPPKPRPRRRS
jgi:hypothetical protein